MRRVQSGDSLTAFSPLARRSAPQRSTLAPESFSWKAISAGLRRKFTGTKTAPSAATAKKASNQTVSLRRRMATRSPCFTPIPASAEASRAERSRSCW